MNNRERAVNQALQKLGDAHRYGRLSLADYRLQRRELLGALRPGETETERNPLLPDDLESAASPGVLSSHLPKANRRDANMAGAGTSRRLWWLGGGVFVVGLLAVAGLVLTEPGETPGRNPPSTAASNRPAGDGEVALDDATATVESEAQTLVDANDWQPATIDRWLMQWRALSPDSQRLLLLRPRLQDLRDQARYRLSVNRALAAGDSPESSAEPVADATRASTQALQVLLDTIDPAR